MTNITESKPNGFALIPFGIFLCFYLGISIFAKSQLLYHSYEEEIVKSRQLRLPGFVLNTVSSIESG